MIKLVKNKYLILNLFLVISIIISLNFKSFKKHIYVSLKKDEYKELMFKCDNAMRDHFIAKQIFDKAPNSDNLKELEASPGSWIVMITINSEKTYNSWSVI